MNTADHSQQWRPAAVSEICLALLPVLCAALLSLRTVPLADLGLQLRIGELIAHGGPFVKEPFAARHLGEELVPNAWLAELVYHQLWRTGGWQLLRGVDAALWLSAFFVAANPAIRRGERPLAVVAGLIFSFALGLPTATIRPQSFAALAFALCMLLLRDPSRRNLALCVPLFVLWQNFHPSVSLAVIVIGTIVGIRWLLWSARQGPPPVIQSLMLGVSMAAVFATPAGISILLLSEDNTRASLLVGATEWLPMWSDHNRPLLWPVLLSAAVWPVLGYRWRAPLEEIVPAAVLLVLSMLAARFVLFYAIALVPLLARLPLGQVLTGSRRSGLRIVGGIAASTILLLAPVRIAPELPRAVVGRLGSVRGTIFGDPAFGGAIVLGYPAARLSHDGRFYLYTVPELELLRQTGSNPETLDLILRQYRPKAFALAKFQSRALIDVLRTRNANWKLVYEDRNAAVFLDRGGDR